MVTWEITKFQTLQSIDAMHTNRDRTTTRISTMVTWEITKFQTLQSIDAMHTNRDRTTTRISTMVTWEITKFQTLQSIDAMHINRDRTTGFNSFQQHPSSLMIKRQIMAFKVSFFNINIIHTRNKQANCLKIIAGRLCILKDGG